VGLISGYLLKEIPRTFRLSVLLRKVHAPGRLDGNFWGLGVHPQLRAASPASRIVVVGKLLDSGDHVRLIHLGVLSFLLWKDISEETLWHTLEAIRHDLCVASKAAADRCGDLDCRREPQRGDIALKPLDHIILKNLSKEMTQQEIAEAAGVGLRTVEEHITILKDKLEAPTPFMLGMKAERFGFLR